MRSRFVQLWFVPFPKTQFECDIVKRKDFNPTQQSWIYSFNLVQFEALLFCRFWSWSIHRKCVGQFEWNLVKGKSLHSFPFIGDRKNEYCCDAIRIQYDSIISVLRIVGDCLALFKFPVIFVGLKQRRPPAAQWQSLASDAFFIKCGKHQNTHTGGGMVSGKSVSHNHVTVSVCLVPSNEL